MKAIYRNKLYTVVDTEGDRIILAGQLGRVVVRLSDPRLIIDPTDDEYFEADEQTEAMRDDIGKLPLSKEAKAYARRSGLKSMVDQPKQFAKVNAQITNPGKPNKVVNYDNGEQTDGKKGAPAKAFKESAGEIVDRLLSS